MDILLVNPPYSALKGLASEHGYSINLVALATYLVSNGIDASVLEAIDKGTTVEQIIKVSQMVSDSGLNSITAVMIGLPRETREDIESTLELMRTINTDIFDVNCYIPLPGTELYDELSKEQKDRLDWKEIGYKSFNNHFTDHLSHAELTEYLNEAYRIASTKLKQFEKQRTLK